MPTALVTRWHALHARALDLNSRDDRLCDKMAQACFAEMAAIEDELVHERGDAQHGAAKLDILIRNYDIGGRDYEGDLADPSLALILSAAADLQPALVSRMPA